MAIYLKETERTLSKEKFDHECLDSALKVTSSVKTVMLTAQNKIFPQETVASAYDRVSRFLEVSEKSQRKPYLLAVSIADAFIDSYYSFTDNLRTGHYAPYLHEQKKFDMIGNNCTTIIPEIYLYCEAVGLRPEIVQFFDFKDIKSKKDEKETVSPSHFSLIIDVGRKYKYLFDPFYHTFGPILEQGRDYLTIGKCRSRPARKRIFRKMLPYSAQDFVEMMDRLHDPAESLDMLVAGQKVYSTKSIAKANCHLMVYYNEETNTVFTRLYVPQKPLTDKAIYARMALDSDGNFHNVLLDGYLARDYGWNSLVNPKKVFETDFLTARSLRRKLHGLKNQEGKKFSLNNLERIGSALLQADQKERETLLSITDKIYRNLSEEERRKLRPMILARTLYESEKPKERYLYTAEQHDARLLEKARYEKEENIKMLSLDNLLYFHNWKLEKLVKSELLKIKRKKSSYDKRMREIVEEINTLNKLRYYNKKAYSRAMDKVLFSESLEGKSPDDLEKIIIDRGFDQRVGYLAMVADFVPFVLEGQEDLELKLYRQPIKEKVFARMKKKAVQQDAVQNLPESITAASELELAVAE